MSCTRPLIGYRSSKTGRVHFNAPSPQSEATQVSCGQCMSCRLEKSRQWAMRCMHEASLHDLNAFITLTYDDDHLPSDMSLVPGHFTNFMKAYRKKLKRDGYDYRIKFFGCGEYGDQTQRPHYHIILFGHCPADKKLHSRTQDEQTLYTSEWLSSLWHRGHCPIGTVSFESAAYVARYALKKITGPTANHHYQGRTPEFVRMSRGGKDGKGIGYDFLQKWKMDIYPHDYAIVNGKKCRPPAYYDAQLPADFLEPIKRARKERAQDNWRNNTDYHLNAREHIQNQKQLQIKRDEI